MAPEADVHVLAGTADLRDETDPASMDVVVPHQRLKALIAESERRVTPRRPRGEGPSPVLTRTSM
jgi:hypothetical protein